MRLTITLVLRQATPVTLAIASVAVVAYSALTVWDLRSELMRVITSVLQAIISQVATQQSVQPALPVTSVLVILLTYLYILAHQALSVLFNGCLIHG